MNNLINANKTKRPHVRRKDKVEHLITWLAKFDFSTRELIGQSMGVNHIGQWSFFKQMIDDDIIVPAKIPGTHKRIFILGRVGNSAMTLYCPDVKVKEHRKTPSLVALSHSFCIQHLISTFLFNNEISDFQTEKELYTLNLKRRPDAIVSLNDKKIAIEVEITKKPLAMVFYNYVCHIQNIRSKIYNKVVYYFNNRDTLKFYQSLYDARLWPLFEKSNNGGRLKQLDKKLDVTQIHELCLIEFKLDDLYTM